MLDQQTVEIGDRLIFKDKQSVPKPLRPANICIATISIKIESKEELQKKHNSCFGKHKKLRGHDALWAINLCMYCECMCNGTKETRVCIGFF